VFLLRIWRVGLLILLFLAVSFLIARWLTAENRERAAVVSLLHLQKEGDSAGMLRMLPGCGQQPKCRAAVVADVRRLQGAGTLTVLRYDSGTSYSFAGASGQTRVAWDRGGATPAVVQCVSVERRGLAIFGGSIILHTISLPIGGESTCPG